MNLSMTLNIKKMNWTRDIIVFRIMISRF